LPEITAGGQRNAIWLPVLDMDGLSGLKKENFLLKPL
jgi:hypothetical protein